jgi:hypothetical protein
VRLGRRVVGGDVVRRGGGDRAALGGQGHCGGPSGSRGGRSVGLVV